eukprot:scaffold913_cov73-Phaeocystis_antarctica.AAC.8
MAAGWVAASRNIHPVSALKRKAACSAFSFTKLAKIWWRYHSSIFVHFVAFDPGAGADLQLPSGQLPPACLPASAKSDRSIARVCAARSLVSFPARLLTLLVAVPGGAAWAFLVRPDALARAAAIDPHLLPLELGWYHNACVPEARLLEQRGEHARWQPLLLCAKDALHDLGGRVAAALCERRLGRRGEPCGISPCLGCDLLAGGLAKPRAPAHPPGRSRHLRGRGTSPRFAPLVETPACCFDRVHCPTPDEPAAPVLFRCLVHHPRISRSAAGLLRLPARRLAQRSVEHLRKGCQCDRATVMHAAGGDKDERYVPSANPLSRRALCGVRWAVLPLERLLGPLVVDGAAHHPNRRRFWVVEAQGFIDRVGRLDGTAAHPIVLVQRICGWPVRRVLTFLITGEFSQLSDPLRKGREREASLRLRCCPSSCAHRRLRTGRTSIDLCSVLLAEP